MILLGMHCGVVGSSLDCMVTIKLVICVDGWMEGSWLFIPGLNGYETVAATKCTIFTFINIF